jgi:hypothetical protein
VLSQNGFQVLETNRTTGATPRLRKWHVPGADRHLFLRDGSAGFLLIHFAAWYHDNVEKIDTGVWQEWGWAVRPVRGQTTGYSNHASGTAQDLRATRHPRGVPTRNTFTQAQIDRIHTRLRLYEGCIRWGGDYKGVPDGMHFEIDRDITLVERKARELYDTPVGRKIIRANPGADLVIWDGKPPAVKAPAAVKEPAPTTKVAADYSYTQPRPKAVKAAGIDLVLRYVPVGKGKDLTAPEVVLIHAADVDLAVVFERTANRAAEGAKAGEADVAYAEREMDKLGYPEDAVIFYAVDFDTTPARVKPYLDAARAASKRPFGVYGSYKVIEGVQADYYWQTEAWSSDPKNPGSRLHSAKAHLIQKVGRTRSIAGVPATAWDENIVRKPIPAWTAQEEDMPLTDADIQKIAKAVASWPVANKTPGEANQTGSLGGMVTRVDYSIDQLATAVTDLTAKVDALQAAVDAGKAPQP